MRPARRHMKIGQGLSNERILVCLPTYHSKIKWVERAVESLKNQTYKNFDCMIVKDGCRHAEDKNTCKECYSCTETIKYCKDIDDERFSFHNLPVNCGAAGWGPRNFAILNSNHNLIAYLDDDNWFEPDHLESLYKALRDNNADMAYTGTRLYDKEMNVVGIRMHPHAPKPGHIDTSEILHKRHLINKHGGWRKVTKCNDWDLVSRWDYVDWSHTRKVTLNFYIREGCGIHRA